MCRNNYIQVPPSRESDVGKHTLVLENVLSVYPDYKFPGEIVFFPQHKVDLMRSTIINAYGAVQIQVNAGNMSGHTTNTRNSVINTTIPTSIELRRKQAQKSSTTVSGVFKMPLSSWWVPDASDSLLYEIPKTVSLSPGHYQVFFTLNNQTFVETSTKLAVFGKWKLQCVEVGSM